MLLAMARVILDEGLADLEYVERWTNWREYMADRQPRAPSRRSPAFLDALREHYREFTPEFAEAESGVPRDKIVEVARADRRARAARSRRTSGAAPPAATWAAGRSRARCSS